jgi:ketosteroid isomerase-like protein
MRNLVRVSQIVAATALLASCASRPSVSRGPANSRMEATQAISLLSQKCADAWNRGDLKGYLEPYSKDVVIVYPSGPEKGIGALEARLRRAQTWDGRQAVNRARIGHSEVSLLDSDNALQTAEIIIQEPGGEVHLWATAILKRTTRGWVVVHEQSF